MPDTAAAVRAAGRRFHEIRCDLSSNGIDFGAVVGEAIDRLGGVDILVNNAGIIRRRDVLDLTDATAEKLLLYEVGPVPQAAKDLARVLLPATQKLQDAVRLLREIKNPAQILSACRDIKTAESDADALARSAIAALFKSGADALSIMKWKEIYDLMESATDRCEDVANVIEGVVLEHA